MRRKGAGAGWSTGSAVRDWSGRDLGGMDGGFGGIAQRLWYTIKGCGVGFPTKLFGNNGTIDVDVEEGVSWLVGKKYVSSWKMTFLETRILCRLGS